MKTFRQYLTEASLTTGINYALKVIKSTNPEIKAGQYISVAGDDYYKSTSDLRKAANFYGGSKSDLEDLESTKREIESDRNCKTEWVKK